MRGSSLALLGAVVLSSGCWSDSEAILAVTWSEDGEKQVYLHSYYEEQDAWGPYGMGHSTRNHQYEVWEQSADGSNRHLLVDRVPGAPYNVRYLRQAGYLLIDAPTPAGYGWYQVDVATGSSRIVAEHVSNGPSSPCEGTDALPSPDGSIIATWELFPPQNPSLGCAGATIEVRFVDADSLDVLGVHEQSISDFPAHMWTADDEFMLWEFGGDAWRVDPDSGFVAVSEPTCIQPRTPSSTLNEDGIRIDVGTVTDPVSVIQTHADTCWWD